MIARRSLLTARTTKTSLSRLVVLLSCLLLVPSCGEDPTLGSDSGADVATDSRDAGSSDVWSSPDVIDRAPEVSPPVDVRCSGICNAATPSYPTVGPDFGQGNVTMYTTEASNGGACNYGATGVMYFVATNVNMIPGDGQGHWQGGRICGQCVEVTALTTQGPRSVVVRIMDKCPDGYCGMDLGGAAPAAVMVDGMGRYDGSWRFVSCAGHPEVSDGPTKLAISVGANAYWSRAQVRNPPGAVLSMSWTDARGASGAFPYASDPENTFEVPTAVLQSTASTITVSARFGDGSSAAVDVTPTELAAPGSSYVMR